MEWKRIAAGDYESSDGRFVLYRLPGVYPPAWNVEDRSDPDRDVLLVDGAASKRDAAALAEEAMAQDVPDVKDYRGKPNNKESRRRKKISKRTARKRSRKEGR